MALCPTVANPATQKPIDELSLKFETPSPIIGDFVLAVTGTRNTGDGTIYVSSIPRGASVEDAYLIVNTYESNDLPDPTIGFAKLPDFVTPMSDTPWSLCGSTCWLNPGSELTTYLRNRVYTFDVGPSGENIVNGNGKYFVNNLPKDLTMPIGFDGCRLPGCKSSQGVALFITYTLDPALNAKKKTPNKERLITLYAGAVLIDPTPATWGGQTQKTFKFSTFNIPDTSYYASNGRCAWVVGDVHPSLGGTNLALNSVAFVPPNNAWVKYGNTISMKNYTVKLYPSDDNQTVLQTSNNCICWSVFAHSGDKSTTPEPFSEVKCVVTHLAGDDSPQIPAGNPGDFVVFYVVNNVVDTEIQPVCGGVLGREFPPPPFNVKIEDELFKVLSNVVPLPTDPIILQGFPNAREWHAQRLVSTGGNPDHNNKCVKLVLSSQGKNAMFKNYANRGTPNQRPNAGRWQGRYR